MKTINEIFKNNPQLLQQDEVKELLEQFKIQYQAMKMKHVKYWNKVTDLINRLNPVIICNDCINEEEIISHDDYDRFD